LRRSGGVVRAKREQVRALYTYILLESSLFPPFPKKGNGYPSQLNGGDLGGRVVKKVSWGLYEPWRA